jgi:hypothetical protein
MTLSSVLGIGMQESAPPLMCTQCPLVKVLALHLLPVETAISRDILLRSCLRDAVLMDENENAMHCHCSPSKLFMQ